jgi:hypothetical protein
MFFVNLLLLLIIQFRPLTARPSCFYAPNVLSFNSSLLWGYPALCTIFLWVFTQGDKTIVKKIEALIDMSRVTVVIIFRPITKPLFIEKSIHPSINKSASILTLPEYVSSCEARTVQPLKFPQGCIGPLTIQK